jgi:hypothetical protein
MRQHPVAINVVPMVDVIFCLCVFFVRSMKFKQLEGSSTLAAEGQGQLRDALGHQETRGAPLGRGRAKTRRQFGARIVEDDGGSR